MRRFDGNPILKPIEDHPWESRMVFNAAAIHLENTIHILYRAMGEDNISRVGYASSKDGYHIDERLPYPVFKPATSHEKYGCEDPRITPIDGELVITYTALRDIVRCKFQIGMTSIKEEDFIRKNWNWGKRWYPFPGVRNKDCVIFPRRINGCYVMFHRIEPDICIAYSDDLHQWYNIKTIMEPRIGKWDCFKIGVAGPPIELTQGWLMIYHGVDYQRFYRLGISLIDKDNPEKILYRPQEPILEPVTDYELFGKVSNVVFSCGAVLCDERLLVYYGGADTVVCVVSYDLNELLP
jgi:predicted GH43/DUF377 family glycosyl hydrolase